MRTLSLVTLLLIASPTRAADPPATPTGAELNEREQAFQEMLTGVKLTGSFTIAGRETPGGPKQESYEIQRLTKVNGANWLILARAKWGDKEATLPFPVRVVWAEDTPMITLDSAGFPGLTGQFGCRVLFHDGRYAGTWQHDDVGGHMFGTIEKLDADEKPSESQ